MAKNFEVLQGAMSYFGGPEDTGVSADEGLALCEPNEVDKFDEDLFLEDQPPGTTGLARRLDPMYFYIACRWDYDQTEREWLQEHKVVVSNPKTGVLALAQPIDWGPNENTGRVADLSPGLMQHLDLDTDDECEVLVPLPRTKPVRPSKPTEVAGAGYSSVVISSGHGLKVRGAAGPSPWGLDEVNEARRVVEQLAKELKARNVEVKTFNDDTSTTQDQNLKTIVSFHNKQKRQLDVSVHFNAYQVTEKAMGTECLYVSQSTLAGAVADAIADCGFIDRGPKKRTDLYFLNNTAEPAILLEVCFVDSSADANVYKSQFANICKAVAKVLSGAQVEV